VGTTKLGGHKKLREELPPNALPWLWLGVHDANSARVYYFIGWSLQKVFR